MSTNLLTQRFYTKHTKFVKLLVKRCKLWLFLNQNMPYMMDRRGTISWFRNLNIFLPAIYDRYIYSYHRFINLLGDHSVIWPIHYINQRLHDLLIGCSSFWEPNFGVLYKCMKIYRSCIGKQYNPHPSKLSETVLQNTSVHNIFILLKQTSCCIYLLYNMLWIFLAGCWMFLVLMKSMHSKYLMFHGHFCRILDIWKRSV